MNSEMTDFLRSLSSYSDHKEYSDLGHHGQRASTKLREVAYSAETLRSLLTVVSKPT